MTEQSLVENTSAYHSPGRYGRVLVITKSLAAQMWVDRAFCLYRSKVQMSSRRLMVTVFRSLSDQRLLQTPTGTRVTLALESPLSSTKRSHIIQVQVRNVMSHDNAQWGAWLTHHIPPDVLSAE
jgi:hypothetical protein